MDLPSLPPPIRALSRRLVGPLNRLLLYAGTLPGHFEFGKGS